MYNCICLNLSMAFPLVQIKFESDLRISEMTSGEGEKVEFKERLYPDGSVEDWLLQVERVMKESLRLILQAALDDYKKVDVLLLLKQFHLFRMLHP